MWIKRIVLNNWRAYERAEFNIPRGGEKLNVVVIGAVNGVGKTSLLEAITLCLYGEKGISNLGRANSDSQREPVAYKNFMDRVFHRSANSSHKASVSLIFDTGDGKEVSIERVWHFGSNREFRPPDELRIEENGDALSIPGLIEERNMFLDGYIAENFLPPSLSPFFLFDGSQVQKMAQQHMRSQVRIGIEGILGVPIVRRLIEDLHDYATLRRNQGNRGRTSDTKLAQLSQRINESERKIKRLKEESKNIVKQLEEAQTSEKKLFKKFQEMDGENVAQIGELREKRGKLEKIRNDLINRMADFLTGDFAISLAGGDILTATASRLCKESSLREWERDKKSGAEKYKKFLENLEKSGVFNLSLPEGDITKLRASLESAWNNVWYPRPDDCAACFLNSDFSDDDRATAIGRLNSLARYGSASEMENIRNARAQNEADLSAVGEKISTIRGDNVEEVKRLHEQMKEVRDQIVTLEKRKGDCEREIDGEEKDLARMRQEFGRETSERKDKDPLLNQSVRAETTARVVEKIIERSYPRHVRSIANEMTSAYLSMDRRGKISEILIDDDCDINLRDVDGKDLQISLSHGESEIFALALIASIVQVSKVRFPFVIDTPLANLDRENRRNFLSYFSLNMDNQILFLSTDEEIRREQMAIIRPRVAHKFLVEQRVHDDGTGRNVVHSNRYFGEDKE